MKCYIAKECHLYNVYFDAHHQSHSILILALQNYVKQVWHQCHLILSIWLSNCLQAWLLVSLCIYLSGLLTCKMDSVTIKSPSVKSTVISSMLSFCLHKASLLGGGVSIAGILAKLIFLRSMFSFCLLKVTLLTKGQQLQKNQLFIHQQGSAGQHCKIFMTDQL